MAKLTLAVLLENQPVERSMESLERDQGVRSCRYMSDCGHPAARGRLESVKGSPALTV